MTITLTSTKWLLILKNNVARIFAVILASNWYFAGVYVYITMINILREIKDDGGDYYTPKMAVNWARQCVGMWWAGLLALVAKFGNDRKAIEDNRGEELECYCFADYSNIYTLFSESTQHQCLDSSGSIKVRNPETCRRTWAPNPGPSTRMTMSCRRWSVSVYVTL